jgi:hypothetical protein
LFKASYQGSPVELCRLWSATSTIGDSGHPAACFSALSKYLFQRIRCHPLDLGDRCGDASSSRCSAAGRCRGRSRRRAACARCGYPVPRVEHSGGSRVTFTRFRSTSSIIS